MRRLRTPVARHGLQHHAFSEDELCAYLEGTRVRIVESQGVRWRNRHAPNAIAALDWTPVRQWESLSREQVGFPVGSALGYRALASEHVSTVFRYVVFRDLDEYDSCRMNRHRARSVRQALDRYEYVILGGPEVLLAQGWAVARSAAAQSGARLEPDESAYRRHVRRMFERTPPVVWAALDEGNLAGYMISYAIGNHATIERLYIAPHHRDQYVGPGLYWSALIGWAQTPSVRTCWAGASMPGSGVDSFKQSMGASLEALPVHAGMRWPVRTVARVVRPDAVSLAALRG